MNGTLEKLTIIPCSDATYNTSSGKPYIALINPEQIEQELALHYTDNAADGGSGEEKTFSKIPAQKMTLKFLFDGTGVIDTSTSSIAKAAGEFSGAPATGKSNGGTVKEQIEKFKETTTKFKPDTHEPNYLKIFWGDIVFKGRITSLKITYTLFKPNGEPLRAIGDAVFEESIDRATQNAAENRNSPDLTHVRTVMEGETLPGMCHRIYKNSKLYLQVAKVNGLSNYRKLEVGTKLFFPPINDQL